MPNKSKSKFEEFISKFIDLDNSIIVKLREFFTPDLIIFILILVAIRISVLGNYKVPTGSMIPTIEIGDKLFANKLAYSLKAPIPFININLIKWSKPKRGDIIAFRSWENEKVMYTKRVIGLPGEKIRISNKDLYINDKKIDMTFIAKVKEYSYSTPRFFKKDLYKEVLVLDKYVHNGFKDNKNISLDPETKNLTIKENLNIHFYLFSLALAAAIFAIGFMKFTKNMLADRTLEQKRKFQIITAASSAVLLLIGIIFYFKPVTKLKTIEKDQYQVQEYDYYYEHLGDVKHFVRFTNDNIREDYSITISKNNYYVMGDNRDNSADSRVYGQLKEDSIEGKLALRWLVFKPHTFVIDFKRLGLVK